MRMASRISSGSRSSICSRQQQAGQHRHQRQRQDHRADQGEDHRQRHRPKQLAFDPFQRQDRQVDDHDDQFAEHRRLADFDRRVADDLQSCFAVGYRRAQCGARSSRSSPPSYRRSCRSRSRPGSAGWRRCRTAACRQNANSIDSGIASATISAARRLPRNTNSTATTSSPPSNRFFCTVSMT